MAAFMGKDVSRLKGKGGGKWKYMSEQDMLQISEKFAPYRQVTRLQKYCWLTLCRSVFMWYMWYVILDLFISSCDVRRKARIVK